MILFKKLFPPAPEPVPVPVVPVVPVVPTPPAPIPTPVPVVPPPVVKPTPVPVPPAPVPTPVPPPPPVVVKPVPVPVEPPPPPPNFFALKAHSFITVAVYNRTTATPRTVGWITQETLADPFSCWFCDGHWKANTTCATDEEACAWILAQAALPSPPLPPVKKLVPTKS